MAKKLNTTQIHRQERDNESSSQHNGRICFQKRLRADTVVQMGFIRAQHRPLHRQVGQPYAKTHTKQHSEACKKEIFCKNLPVKEAQCLIHADELSLLLHHTGYGGIDNQCTHNEKDDGERHAERSKLV